MNDKDLEELLADETASNEPAAMKARTEAFKKFDEQDAKLRKEAVANMLVNGAPRDQIVRLMGKSQIVAADGNTVQPGFAMTAREVDLAIKAIRAEWEEEEADFRRYAKAVTQRRLLAEINEARRDKSHNAVANLEKVLMMVQGTAEPLEVQTPTDNRVTDAILRILSESDPVKVRVLIEKERSLTNGVESNSAPMLPPGEISSVKMRRKGKRE